MPTGADPEVRGAAAVAETFSGRAKAAQPAMVDGLAATRLGLRRATEGRLRLLADGRIVAIHLLADADQLAGSTWSSSTTDDESGDHEFGSGHSSQRETYCGGEDAAGSAGDAIGGEILCQEMRKIEKGAVRRRLGRGQGPGG